VEQSTLTVFNFVNSAYKIADDRGFDNVIATFKYSIDGISYETTVICNSNGECFSSKKLNQTQFDEIKG
jgi:hypothetical protein